MWQHKSDINVASVHVQVKEEANAQMIRHRVSNILKSTGATHSTVQVEKKTFAHRIQQVCPGYKAGYTVRDALLLRGQNIFKNDNFSKKKLFFFRKCFI